MKSILRIAVAVALIECISGQFVNCFAQGTAFTYQGRLNVGGAAANGSYDVAFTLFNTNTTGSAIAGPVTNAAVSVTNGLFTTLVNFGPGVFTGASNWLQIAVSTNAANSFSTLSPRQQITPTPYAIFAITSSNLSGTLPAAQLSGTLAPANIAAGTITSTMLAPDAVTMLGTPGNGPTNTVNVSSNGLVGIGTGNNIPSAGLQINNGAIEDALSVIYEVQNGSGGFTNLAGPYTTIVTNNLLAVGAQSGITLVSITNISAPVPVAQLVNNVGVFTNIYDVTGLAWAGSNLVAASLGSNAVTIISCTNPANPVKLVELKNGVNGWNYLGETYSVAVSSNLLAIAAPGSSAVTLADISNPSAPVLKSTLVNGTFGFTNLGGAVSVAISGNLMAVGAIYSNAVTLVNVSNPANPVKLAEIRNGVGGFTNMNGVYGVALNGNLLAIAAFGSSTVTMVDVSTPANPVFLSQIVDGIGGYSITQPYTLSFSGSLLVIGTAGTSITLVNVSNPSSPMQVGAATYGMNGADYLSQPTCAAIVGTNMIVPGHGGNSLTILSMSPQLVGLDSANWVGIGTTAPKASLDVVGNVIIEDANQFNVSATHVTIGSGAIASNTNAISIGDNTTASGTSAIALGQNTLASGNFSTAMGYYTIASGSYSTAMGQYSTASGSASTAMGYSSSASGDVSLAQGFLAIASGDYSIALGSFASASAGYSTAIGESTVATGTNATALGYNTLAAGFYSLAAGQQAQALHQGAFVWADSQNAPFSSTASDQYLIRARGGVGIGTMSPDAQLDVAGPNGTSIRVTGPAGGGATVAYDLATYNPGTNAPAAKILATDDASYSSSLDLMTKGPGAITNPLHSRVHIASSGNVGIGVGTPGFMLDVGGRIRLRQETLGSPAGLWLYQNDTGNDRGFVGLQADGYEGLWGNLGANWGLLMNVTNGFVGIGNAAPSTYLQVVNATCNGSSWVNASDRNLKQDFAAVDTAAVLAKVIAMPVQSWDYKAQPGDKHIGPVAQDFHAAFGLNGADDRHIATVDESGVALAAIQGLNRKLETENAALKSQNDALADRLNQLETLVKQMAVKK